MGNASKAHPESTHDKDKTVFQTDFIHVSFAFAFAFAKNKSMKYFVFRTFFFSLCSYYE